MEGTAPLLKSRSIEDEGPSGVTDEDSERVTEQFLKVSDAREELSRSIALNEKDRERVFNKKSYKKGPCYDLGCCCWKCLVCDEDPCNDGTPIWKKGEKNELECGSLCSMITSPLWIVPSLTCLFSECVCCFIPSKISEFINKWNVKHERNDLDSLIEELDLFDDDDMVPMEDISKAFLYLSPASIKKLSFSQLRQLPRETLQPLIDKRKIHTDQVIYWRKINQVSDCNLKEILDSFEYEYLVQLFLTIDEFFEEYLCQIPLMYSLDERLKISIIKVLNDYFHRDLVFDDVEFRDLIIRIREGESIHKIIKTYGFTYDIKLVFDDKVVRANKQALCEISPVFQSKLSSRWGDKDDFSFSSKGFPEIIEFSRTGQIELSERNLEIILTLSDFYGIEVLLEKCFNFLKKFNPKKPSEKFLADLGLMIDFDPSVKEFFIRYISNQLKKIDPLRKKEKFIKIVSLIQQNHLDEELKESLIYSFTQHLSKISGDSTVDDFMAFCELIELLELSDPYYELLKSRFSEVCLEDHSLIKSFWDEANSQNHDALKGLVIRFCRNTDNNTIKESAWVCVPDELVFSK